MKFNSGDKQKGREIVDFPENKSIQKQASEWLAKLDNEKPAKRDLKAFKKWINADADHRKTFEELIIFWDDLNILTQIVLPREKKVQRAATDNRLTFMRLGKGYALSGLATLVLFALAVLIFPQLQTSEPLMYSTMIGEQKTIELPDHTTILLNTNSRIEVKYNKQHRGVKLVRGEAHFDVFHDPSRPFEVSAGNRLVRALGTAFTIHLRKVDVEVIVTEGVVEIDSLTPYKTDKSQLTQSTSADSLELAGPDVHQVPIEVRVQVKAGNMATFDLQELNMVREIVEKQLEKKLSWQQGILVFKGEPLREVVEEVSRYTSLKIIIPERNARELKVGGLFKVGDTESMFEALREGFDIHAEYVSDDLVYLISNENR